MSFRIAFVLLSMVLVMSSCLTRKNAIPSGKYPRTTHKGSSGKLILTDASNAAKDVRVSANLLESYAAVLGVDSRAIQNPTLYKLIDEWMGTPHRLGGTDKRGVDCSAFVSHALKAVYGKTLPRTSREMAETVKRKYERQLVEGDLVFFSFGNRNVDHVGIYLHNHKFVHVSTSKGVIISNLRDSWYYRYFTRAGTAIEM